MYAYNIIYFSFSDSCVTYPEEGSRFLQNYVCRDAHIKRQNSKIKRIGKELPDRFNLGYGPSDVTNVFEAFFFPFLFFFLSLLNGRDASEHL